MYVGTKCFKNIKFRIKKKKERRAGYVIRRKNEKRR